MFLVFEANLNLFHQSQHLIIYEHLTKAKDKVEFEVKVDFNFITEVVLASSKIKNNVKAKMNFMVSIELKLARIMG